MTSATAVLFGRLVLLLCLSTRALSKAKHKTKGVVTGASSTTPNVIFILADDLGWGSGGFGERGTSSDVYFATPTLNSWAASGIKLTSYYAQEVCTPGRAALMTGRYPLTIGMQYGGVEATSSWGLNETEVTIANVLQDNGYTNYMLGKWNLGHFSASLLPGARGFNYWLAYQTGSMFYWSKKDPESKTSKVYFKDLTYGDSTCYSGYSGPDEHVYSTYLFRDKAINAISNHNYDSTPLFMYLAFQAVHDPFTDFKFPNGVPKSYIEDDSIKTKIKNKVVGRKRRQYATSLYLLDEAVGKIHDAVEDAGQLENTYFIFTSDNGGCYDSGGRNGPLRGNKGNLFEGGTKVDALIYSKLLSKKQAGATYTGLFHVSDWFPTILDMASISYTPASSNTLDGVSHWSTIAGLDVSSEDEVTSPRTVMLYNYYTDVINQDGWGDTPVRAVRNTQYKLIETWENSDAGYYWPESTLEDDSDLSKLGSCQQPNSWSSGTYTQYLFDLKTDPYEQNNLWGLPQYASEQADLYAHLQIFLANAKSDKNSYGVNSAAFKKFKAAGGYIVPWVTENDEASGAPVFIKAGCSVSYISPDHPSDDNDFVDTDPTFQPTNAPTTASPSHRPTKRPTQRPSNRPSYKPTSQHDGQPTKSDDHGHHPSTDDRTTPDVFIVSPPTRQPTKAPVGPPTREAKPL